MAAAPAAEEARKVVTVVFSDLADSTAIGHALDPESVRRLMGRYFDEMRSGAGAPWGRVEKFIGDAVMAVFGVPVVARGRCAARRACGRRDARPCS